MKSVKSLAVAGLVLAAAPLALAAPAVASGHKVYGPEVEKGEFELEYGALGLLGDDDGEWKHFFEAGYGVTDFWNAAVFAEVEDAPGSGARLEAIAFENIFELPTPESWPVAFGLYAEYEVGLRDGSQDEVELKALAEHAAGAWRSRVNLIAERHVGAGASDETEYGYAAQVRRAIGDEGEWALGLEAYGGAGDSDDGFTFDDQSHVAGPVLFGELPIGIAELEFEAGVLFGLTDESPDTAVKFLLEWERRF